MAEKDGFIGRWSRRKLGSQQKTSRGGAEPVVDPKAPRPDDDKAEAATAATPARAAEGVDPVALPDIETLDRNSDFTPFLKAGVPAELKNRALRRLWRLDPTFANLDGLVDYGEDFTDKALVVKGLKTAYRVGQGFLREVVADKTVPETKAADAAATTEKVEQAEVGDGEADSPAAGGAETAKRPGERDEKT